MRSSSSTILKKATVQEEGRAVNTAHLGTTRGAGCPQLFDSPPNTVGEIVSQNVEAPYLKSSTDAENADFAPSGFRGSEPGRRPVAFSYQLFVRFNDCAHT